MRELSYRRVNMYRGIISFSPETAAELGLTDHKAWEDYIERHILTLANSTEPGAKSTMGSRPP